MENLTKVNINLELSNQVFDDRFSRKYLVVRYVGSSRRVRVFDDGLSVLKYLSHMGLSTKDVFIYSLSVCCSLVLTD